MQEVTQVQWVEMRIKVPPIQKEPVANRLFELGAQGVTETDQGGDSIVSGYFQEELKSSVCSKVEEFVTSLSELFPNQPKCQWEIVRVPAEDWVSKYREFFKAQPLSKLFFLRPAWDKSTKVPDAMIPICMELGQAFGTGLHASSRLCIKLIERVIDYYPQQASARFLDVGTGTGILSIVAHKLGLRRIVAIDIDPLAIEAARENFTLNACQGVDLVQGEISAVKGPFEIIVSNILLETHVSLVPWYRKLLSRGGQLLLSGLLTSQKAEIDDLLTSQGFTVERSEFFQEWAAIQYTAP